MACLKWKQLTFGLLLFLSLVSTFIIDGSFNNSSAAVPNLSTADTSSLSNLEILQAGMVTNMERAVEAIADSGRRKEAMVAVDEAHRIAKVGAYAESSGGGSFSQVATAVEEVWRHIQNGQPEAALNRLKEATATLEQAPVPDAFAAPEPIEADKNARLLNAYGEIVGDLERTPEGTFTATVGGWQNVLGFLEFGGTSFTLPADKLVFGKQQIAGYDFVVLADEGNPDEIISRYRPQSL